MKLKRVIFRVCVIFLGLLIVSFTIWRIKLAHDVNTQLQTIQAAGLPTSGEELDQYYPEVPDDQNAALVIEQAFTLMANYADQRSNAIVHFKTPACSQPLTSGQKELLSGYVELNQTAIQTATQGLLRTECRYSIGLWQGLATPLPHLSQLRGLAQVVSYEGMLAVEDNHPEEAVESISAIVRLSRTLENEPLIISDMVRFRMDNMAKLTLERCLNARQLSGENLASLNQALQGWESTNNLFQAMVGERAMAIPVFGMNFAQFSRFAESEDADIRLIQERPSDIALTFLMRASGFFERDLGYYLTLMKTNISFSKISPPDNLAITNVWNNAMKEIERRHLIMSAMLLPGLNVAYLHNAEAIANVRISKVAVAVEQFRLLQNRLPLTLDELNALTSSEIRTDPFNGQPLRYKRLEKGYVVYSVGRDGHDNGGRERPADAKSTDKTEYDLTFTVER